MERRYRRRVGFGLLLASAVAAGVVVVVGTVGRAADQEGWDPTGQGVQAVAKPQPAGTGAAAQAASAPTEAAPAKREVKVSEAARALIGKVDEAYRGLGGLELAGTLSGHFEIGGEKKDESLPISASYRRPGMFRHEGKGDVVVGANAEKAYALSVGDNVYVQADAPKEATGVGAYPPVVGRVLSQQNPSLVLALAREPGKELLDGVAEVERADDTAIDGVKYPTLKLTVDGGPGVTLAFDPKTNLLRRQTSDLSAVMQKRGAADVKTARLVVDYPTAKVLGAGSPIDPKVFAWAPPAGSRELTAGSGGGPGDAALALQGKPAPDFTLKDMAGADVTLSSLKGSVVVLDFWATWCGPCVMSLPGLDALNKEKSRDGVKMFAVNQQEEPARVKGFVEQKGLTLPVLLDTSGVAGEKFKVEALPTTVVIGRDGVVKKVIVGAGDEDAVRSAVEAALR